jgi:carboxypeptidase family protein
MARFRFLLVSLVCVTSVFAASTARAQLTTASGIAGVVKDASGAVLPGVTVEAASPALIEKVRTVVTDGEGRYNIIGLPSGTYAVTFTLTGFNTIKRDGIILTAGFTAPVNAELKVGNLEETVTVTGASPIVDVQNVRQQTVISKQLLEALPSATGEMSVLQSMTPGLTGTASLPDVGGSAGYRDGMGSNANNLFHGRIEMIYRVDGLSILSVLNNGTFSFVPNPLLLGESTVETGGTAESSGSGLAINAIPQDGSNKFSYLLNGVFSNGSMQSDNLTPEWISRGIQAAGHVDFFTDDGGSVGGPIKTNKAWFFAAGKVQNSKTFQTNNFYNALQNTAPYVLYAKDLSKGAHTDNLQRSGAGRITYQMSPRNKLTGTFDIQNNCVCHQQNTLQAPEAQFLWHFYPSWIGQVTWSMPVSNKLLLEAAGGAAISWWSSYLQPEVSPNNIPVTEGSNNYAYGMGTPRNPDRDERYNQRASLSYVTGTHNIKVGMVMEELFADYGIGFIPNAGLKQSDYTVDLAYTFLNQTPTSITEYSRPFVTKDRVKPDLGIFAQDQWTIKRATFNYGARFDYFSGFVPQQDTAATRFVPARHFDRVDNLPNLKDFSPRVGVAYDLFGTGRTAVKVNIGRYVSKEGTGIADMLNPINTSVNSVTRVWGDANHNYIPDCDLTNPLQNGECLQIDNLNFGKSAVATTWAQDTIQGWGNRPANWDFTFDVQQQLGSAVSLSAGYDRNWTSVFRVTNNQALTPSDYTQFCVTAPLNADLPGGGGFPVCGLYDVNPSKFSVVPNNVVTQASNFGTMRRVSDFFNVNLSTRFRSGLLIRGGIDTGTFLYDSCEVRAQIPSLGGTAVTGLGTLGLTQPFCHSKTPFMGNTQLKVQGSYPLPWSTVVSAIFQNVPSVPYAANYRMTNAQVFPSLGRNLAACGTRTLQTCTASIVVGLIDPNTSFEARRTQLDLRVTKMIALGQGRRLQANLDLYNALNSAALLTTNSTFATVNSQWRSPTAILAGRLLQVSARLTF